MTWADVCAAQVEPLTSPRKRACDGSVEQALSFEGLCRKIVNERVGIVKHAFKWATGEDGGRAPIATATDAPANALGYVGAEPLLVERGTSARSLATSGLRPGFIRSAATAERVRPKHFPCHRSPRLDSRIQRPGMARPEGTST